MILLLFLIFLINIKSANDEAPQINIEDKNTELYSPKNEAFKEATKATYGIDHPVYKILFDDFIPNEKLNAEYKNSIPFIINMTRETLQMIKSLKIEHLDIIKSDLIVLYTNLNSDPSHLEKHSGLLWQLGKTAIQVDIATTLMIMPKALLLSINSKIAAYEGLKEINNGVDDKLKYIESKIPSSQEVEDYIKSILSSPKIQKELNKIIEDIINNVIKNEKIHNIITSLEDKLNYKLNNTMHLIDNKIEKNKTELKEIINITFISGKSLLKLAFFYGAIYYIAKQVFYSITHPDKGKEPVPKTKKKIPSWTLKGFYGISLVISAYLAIEESNKFHKLIQKLLS